MRKIDLLGDIQGKIWAITQEWADKLVVAATQKPSIESREPDQVDSFDIISGVAIIPVKGALSKDYGWTGWYSGINSGYLGIREQVELALLDPSVSAILLAIDSPGGTVDGAKELADFMSQAADQKPLFAFANGQMTSAAYWIAASAAEIAAPETALVGSIGARTMHIDWSGFNEQYGIKITHIASGEYKAEPNPDAPLSKKAKQYVQDHIDQTAQLFAQGVSAGRGIPAQQILDMQARVFLAGEALGMGLIDRIEQNIDTFLQHIIDQEGLQMNLDKLKADHPDLYNQVKAEGAKEAEAAAGEGVKTARKESADAVLGLVKAVCGDEIHKKVSDLSAAGVTASQAEAMKSAFGATETAKTPEEKDETERKKVLTALQEAHSEGVPQGLTPGAGQGQENPLIADAQRRAKEVA